MAAPLWSTPRLGHDPQPAHARSPSPPGTQALLLPYLRLPQLRRGRDHELPDVPAELPPRDEVSLDLGADHGDGIPTLRWQLHRACPDLKLLEEVEQRFHPTRRWRFDLAFPERKVAVELDGGVFSGGRHARGAGIRSDCEKFSEAAALGWRVLRVLPEHVQSGQALTWLEKALRFDAA